MLWKKNNYLESLKTYILMWWLFFFSISFSYFLYDSPSDSDEFSEEVIYSQESPKMVDIITDFDWDSGRFVEFKSPFTKKRNIITW